MAVKLRKNRFILCLAGGQSVAEAARETGISERQGYRWLQDGEVRRQLDELRGRAVGVLAEQATAAARRLGTGVENWVNRSRLERWRISLPALYGFFPRKMSAVDGCSTRIQTGASERDKGWAPARDNQALDGWASERQLRELL